MRQRPEDETPRDRGLATTIRRTRAGMAGEALLRAFWPFASLLAVFWSVMAFGLPELLTRGQMIGVLAAFGVGALWLVWRGLRGLRWPSAREARDRIDATLPGTPLAALEDAQALGTGDAGARAVWAAHLERMRRAAAAARPVPPDLRLASRDPWALRLAALVLLGAALLFAGGEGIRGVGAAIKPAGPSQIATGPSFEGWAEPPDYTGRPTLYLPDIRSAEPVSVPSGTKITLRVYGAEGSDFALNEDVSGGDPVALAESAPGIAGAELAVRENGEITLSRGGAALGHWVFAAEPDMAPTIALSQPVTAIEEGKTRIAYVAKDDHGIARAQARIVLDAARADRRYGLEIDPAPRPPLVIDLPMPMTGAGAEVNEALVDDFAKDPFAGLPVTLTLSAEDAIGQRGDSGPIATILPARPFYDPLAAALIEQRRDLLWSPGNATRVTRVLRAVSAEADEIFESPRAYLITRAAIRDLHRANTEGRAGEVVEDVAEALWQAALLIEDGGLMSAKARLDRARERLSEALRNDAPDEEIARLMDELRDATREYMRQMAREAIERGEQQRAENAPDGQTMSQDQIQELMRRIQELSEQGRKAEAEQLLGMLQQLLDNMRMQVTEGGQGEGQPGEQTMQGLADALREQQGLADESFEELQRQFRENRGQNQGNPGQMSRPPGRPGDESRRDPEGGGQPGAAELARRQEALRQLMEEMRDALPGEAGEAAREAMREAERNMGEARDRLNEDDAGGALDRQAEAIDRLREGMREMAEDMRARNGQQTGEGDEESQSRAENGRDPLGRPLGSRGGIGGNERVVPDADAIARGRALLDEIRRRAGEQFRPEIELDYLRRLLDQF